MELVKNVPGADDSLPRERQSEERVVPYDGKRSQGIA
jgi:hypothetical protein